MPQLTNYLKLLLAISGTIYLLHTCQVVLVPLIWAVILFYFIVTLSSEIYKIPWFNRKLPFWGATLLANLLFFLILFILISIVKGSIGEIVEVAPTYQTKLLELIQQFFAMIGVAQPESLQSVIKSIDFKQGISAAGNILKDGAGKLGIVLIYVVFLLLEYHTFERKLLYIVPNRQKRRKFLKYIHQITADLKTYLAIKSATSFTTGVVSFIFLSIIGVDFALFWALLIFILNYIPTIGSIIAVSFPLIVSLVQFDGMLHFTFTAISLIGTQFALGNILEPRLLGKSLNLSPFIIILSLGIWGRILGLTGMFLCVPFMVILNLVLSHFPHTRPIAVLLSAKGKVLKKNNPTF